ncbi:MAG TPA: guanylate kinase [Candidatus Methylomirabilis sp.]|nr:guanylate kinase [Candidatus Methylomirabilis sp.]
MRNEMVTRGDIFVISAPSGSGKTTICRELLSRVEGISLPVSCTTRERKQGEKEGVDYYFMDEVNFGKIADSNEFLESASVYGRRYGTSRRAVDAIVSNGLDAVLEIDVQGGASVKAAVPEAVLVGILPPDWETLRKRLFARGRDSREEIERRLAAAQREIRELGRYDYLVVNDDLETAVRQVEWIVRARRLRRERTFGAIGRILGRGGEEEDGSSNG